MGLDAVNLRMWNVANGDERADEDALESGDSASAGSAWLD